MLLEVAANTLPAMNNYLCVLNDAGDVNGQDIGRAFRVMPAN